MSTATHTRPLTARQSAFVAIIRRRRRETGLSPTYRVAAAAMGFKSQNSVLQYIKAIRKKGWAIESGHGIIIVGDHERERRASENVHELLSVCRDVLSGPDTLSRSVRSRLAIAVSNVEGPPTRVDP